MNQVTGLALYSGGLDSTLACRVVAEQEIRVIAVRFVTPFFSYDLLDRETEYRKETKDKYCIDVRLVDISEKYFQMLKKPAHGYGKNFNPCIDCKILLLTEARKMMDKYEASFLITGEVVGQRPMSQRRDTLRAIERESGCEDILLRPLCAKLLSPTKPERDGLINRERLLGFSGRTRIPQMELAEHFDIKDYPSPAGGCTLTDPALAARIEKYFAANNIYLSQDIRLLMVGRQFTLPGGSWLVVGRNKEDNDRIEKLRLPEDLQLELQDRPGPTALLRNCNNSDDIKLAAGMVVRYGKKTAEKESVVTVESSKGTESITTSSPDDSLISTFSM